MKRALEGSSSSPNPKNSKVNGGKRQDHDDMDQEKSKSEYCGGRGHVITNKEV